MICQNFIKNHIYLSYLREQMTNSSSGHDVDSFSLPSVTSYHSQSVVEPPKSSFTTAFQHLNKTDARNRVLEILHREMNNLLLVETAVDDTEVKHGN